LNTYIPTQGSSPTLGRSGLTHPFLVAQSGYGSRGSETSYFGPKLKSALIKFQNYYRSEILTPSGLARGTGIFGPATRKKINALLNVESGTSNVAGGNQAIIPCIPNLEPQTSNASTPSREQLLQQLNALLEQLRVLQGQARR